EARGLAEEAVAIAGQTGACAEEAIARTALGSALVNLGEVDVGLAELETAARLATQADDVTVALRAIHNRSDVLLATGRLDEAAAVALGGLAEARPLLRPVPGRQRHRCAVRFGLLGPSRTGLPPGPGGRRVRRDPDPVAPREGRAGDGPRRPRCGRGAAPDLAAPASRPDRRGPK